MKNINLKKVGALVTSVVVVAGFVAFFGFTAPGKAIVFAVTDTQTVLDARQVKIDYVQGFKLGLE